MNLDYINKLFTKKQSEICLKELKPDLFGLRSGRCTKETYIGKTCIKTELSLIDIYELKNWIRNYSITNPDGKYSEIHKDPEYYKDLIKKTSITKEDSPCSVQGFSEEVVKKSMRLYIQEKRTESIDEFVKNMIPQLINHTRERMNQQTKADYSEYLMLQSNENIIPTLKHTSGIDMFLLHNDGSIEALDIKTTRNLWEHRDTPKEAIKALYEKQGEDRFSSDPRFYIHLTDNTDINKDEIMRQFNTTYDITFNYKHKKTGSKTYNVNRCRLVIV